MSLRASFRTFGCKLNQAESDSIAALFKNAGVEIVDSYNADIIVFNTCTVTSKAEQKARREIRLALRQNPRAVAIITGCYAEVEPLSLSQIATRTIIVPGQKKGIIPAMVESMLDAKASGIDIFDELKNFMQSSSSTQVNPFVFSLDSHSEHSRRQLKVQDGCSHRCTYCRVCLARGRSVSLDSDEVVRRAVALEKNGVSEIVLTGVNLAQYKSGTVDFPELLKKIHSGTNDLRIRLSSYDPDCIDEKFSEAFALSRVQPHMHFAVQSGSDAILHKMARAYKKNDVIRGVEAIRKIKPESFIGFDIITGFPGESEEDFEQTLDLLRQTEPTWVHVFPFSPRPGTPAFTMKPCVPERISVERVARVQAIADNNRRNFANHRIGKVLEAVLEGDESRFATSSDYLKLEVANVPSNTRGIIRCYINRACEKVAQENSTDVDLFADFVE